jgi:Spy/CpxP family protein refolding chaperone
MPRRLIVAVALAVLALTASPLGRRPVDAANPEPVDAEAAYTRTINERADKIVATLGINDSAQATRVRDLVAAHYRALRDIHDKRDAQADDVGKSPAADPTVAAAWSRVTSDQATLKLNDVHRRFVARLSVELTPEQVEKVKDGLTYGVVRITYERYLELLPGLNDEQKREILANLIEAREHAMDGGSSEEKHATFGKYKGRINNYLSAQGIDLKAAEKELAARQKSAKQNR